MSTRRRVIRYGLPVAVVIVGVLFAAADTHRLGNTVATVAIAGGLVWLISCLGSDMGMTTKTGRSPQVPDPPPWDEEDPRGEPSPPPVSRS